MPTIEISEKNFEEVVTKSEIVFVDFWASWCAPCRAFAPIFERTAEKHPDVVFGKVNTDVAEELAREFEIRSIPTLMVLKDGVVVFSQAGVLPAAALEDLVRQAKALDMATVRAKPAEAVSATG